MLPLLQAKIDAARQLEHVDSSESEYSRVSISSVLEARSRFDPDDPFLSYLDERGIATEFSNVDFLLRVQRVAIALRDRLGIRPGDRVATALHNHASTLTLYFAAWHVGASVVPLNVNEDDKRLDHVLRHSRAKILCMFDEYAPRMREIARPISSLETIVSENSGAEANDNVPCLPNEVRLREILPNKFSDELPAPRNSDDEALVVYTSGTTGVPKGVALSQYNLLADANAIARWHGLSRDSRMMCVLPVHHVNGIVATHIAPLVCGGSVVLNRKFSAHKFFETAGRFGVHIISVVPTLLQFLLETLPADFDARKAAPQLSYLICGAGPLTVELAARFEDRFGIPICHGYGLSETTCYSCFVPVEKCITPEHTKWMRDFGYPSIGIPLDINEMAIHGEHGEALAEGVKGEIVVRGRNVMLGYHDNDAANEAAFTHGWFRSGDEGFFKTAVDGAHYFFITGRYKELIVRGGVKISPLEVDEVLNRIPGVKAAMAVGFENTTYGEEVGAYVVKMDGSTLDEAAVLAACRAALPCWMSPKVVVFGETFPVTSTGKYRRNELKGLFEKFKDAQFK